MRKQRRLGFKKREQEFYAGWVLFSINDTIIVFIVIKINELKKKNRNIMK